jgi:tetratricopeptide (TPR) repeat protein
MVRKNMLLCGLVVMALFGLMPGTSRSATTASGPKQYWQKGLDCARTNLYIDAVEQFSLAIGTNKGQIEVADVAKIFNSRGLAYLALHETDKAIDDFSNAMELDGKNPEFAMNRGKVYAGSGEWEKAGTDFSTVIKLDPGSGEAYAGRANAFLKDKDFDRALADLARLVEMEPRNAAALYEMGLAFRGKGQDEKAVAAFNDALKIDPHYYAASYQNASIFARAGKIDAACVWLEEAVANGFRDRDALKNSTDFSSLRNIDCYRKAIAGP